MAEKINDKNVYVKFLDDDGEFRFRSVCEIVMYGVPCNDDCYDMKKADSLLYVWREDKWVALS